MTEPSRRVFFALWPDAALAQALAGHAAQAARCCGGRRTRQENLHVTLAFIGGVTGAQVAELVVLAQALRGERFEITLDRLGWWKHNRIVWAGAEVVAPALAQLAQALAAACRAAGYRIDTRPFAAHVTLLRDARCTQALPAIAPLAWRPLEFLLMESNLSPAGASYAPVARFPLG
jgi:2'-5' RNA ligase